MSKRFLMLVVTVLAFGCMAWAAGKAKSWTGTVSDSNCGAKHATASDEAAACVAKCVSGGGKYTLVAKGKVYQVEPQDKFADFAGKSVKVTGTMSGDSITATEVAAGPAHKMGKKKAEKKAS